jgi:autoinducer 2-degrading protein
MHVVTVEFVVQPAHAAAFGSELVANARASRAAEPGCRQFDVCASPDDPATFFLYEIYADRAAFDAHLATPHFRAFDATVRDWVVRKAVRAYRRIDP